MSDPNKAMQQLIERKLAQQKEERKNQTARNIASVKASSDRYVADRNFMKESLKIQAEQDRNRLGTYIDLITQLNKFDEQNPQDKYFMDEDEKYKNTKLNKMYYIDKEGNRTDEEIPFPTAIRMLNREQFRLDTREQILTGVKSIDPFGNVVNRENPDAKRIKQRGGKITVDGKTLQKIQDDIRENPTVTLPDEQDDEKTDVMSVSQMKSRKGRMTVGDLMQQQRERGKKNSDPKPLKEEVSNAGGFNAGSSPNQFLGGRVSFPSSGIPEPQIRKPNPRGIDDLTPIPYSSRRNN